MRSAECYNCGAVIKEEPNGMPTFCWTCHHHNWPMVDGRYVGAMNSAGLVEAQIVDRKQRQLAD